MVSSRSRLHVIAWLVTALAVLVVCLLIWGGDLLVASDPLPSHADTAVVLQGSVRAEKARMSGAIDLLRQGIVDRVLLSVPKESYWGQSIPPVALAYLERNYGADLASRVDFCETGADVNSTEQEAEALNPCIREHGWRSVVIVTSNYHTRRAKRLWARTTRQDSDLQWSVHGVADPEFQQPWWRHRQAAKIWLLETSKLASSMLP
jgi:uncharacterized SAM-binding protein YcdF (DUF218 family)